jgi:hypothetical protein
MTNTAVQRIVQKTSSPLVIARCPAEAIKIINTQRNQPMCIDIFLYLATDGAPSARPAANATRRRPRDHPWGTGLQRPAPDAPAPGAGQAPTPQRGSRRYSSARVAQRVSSPDISLFVTTNRRQRRAPEALEQDGATFAYSECAKVAQSWIGTPMGYPAGQPQAAILPPQKLHSRRSQEDWRLAHRGTDSVSASQHRVARRRQPGVPRPQTTFVTKTGFFPRNQTGWHARPIL